MVLMPKILPQTRFVVRPGLLLVKSRDEKSLGFYFKKLTKGIVVLVRESRVDSILASESINSVIVF